MSELAWGEVEMLVLDVDGVLTDGGLWVAADGAVTKRFFVRDGSGIVRLQRRRPRRLVDWARADPAVTARAEEARHRSPHRRQPRQSQRTPQLELINGCADERYGLCRR